MMPGWIIVAVLAGLTSNLGNFLFRYLLKEGDDATAYAWFHEVFRFVFYAFISFFSFRLVKQPRAILTLLGLGIVEFGAVYTLMKMHSYSHLSISTIISRTRLIWVPIIAFFIFREKLLFSEYIGIIVLFIGLSIVSSPKKILVDRGQKFAYLSAFVIAWVSIFLKLSAPFANTYVIMVFNALPSVFLLPIFVKNAKQRIGNSLKINFPLKILTGFVNALSMFLLAKAVVLGPVSKVTAIRQSMMIASVLAGIIILKEKEDILKKIIGSVISIVGVLLLTTS